ncbi:MAG: SPASM domain-containing protein [Candidatus Aminicenantes bacterium]|nr:SPASM domain-containing protein [Candidatus Aminicenantes bacterium]
MDGDANEKSAMNLRQVNDNSEPTLVDDDIGESGMPLCREPWENFYILRRGILPCCYGNPIGYSFNEYKEAWNSPQIQEIRRYLSQGKLGPYCLECPGCPIVQRYFVDHPDQRPRSKQRPFILRFMNRVLFRVPGKIFSALIKER